MKLGVCYYPEQWSPSLWEEDATRMREAGISHVRIGEFAWSRIEPEPGRFDWHWYDRAVELLASAGLKLVLGTPTATPPKWLVDRHPDIMAWDEQGRPRRFGSRRHYCFSSPRYREESARITMAVAERYGSHPAVEAWQTDNEYGCHDTVVSYSPAAAAGFRCWLKERYRSVEALNAAWGTVFWSQEYRTFDEIDPPNLTVTEANPAHRLDYQRFASDEVVAFNSAQVAILRRLSPGRDIVHNFMGFFTGFDHHRVAADIDAATWDSYPLGFLDQGWDDDAVKARFLRQGHPDFAAFHHDLYRGCGKGRMWVMEQQPGPVNWAPHNPAPLSGMVRLWTLEAFAHGAELVSYFRWRQAPFGQEQMHAGLLRPDNVEAEALGEVRRVREELERLKIGPPARSRVALLFSYEAHWLLDVQPQGAGFDPLRLTFEFYSGLRALGLDVDILPPDAELGGYGVIVAPSLPIMDLPLIQRLTASGARVLLGPRSGSKTADFQIPAQLAPGVLQEVLPIRVTRVESLRPGHREPLADGRGAIITWLEQIDTDLAPQARLGAGRGVWFRNGPFDYLAGWPDADLLDRVLRSLASDAGLDVRPLEPGVRLRRGGELQFAFNYDSEAADIATLVPDGAVFVTGSPHLPPAGVAAWRVG